MVDGVASGSMRHLEYVDKNKMQMEAAAVKLQGFWRCRQARREVSKMKYMKNQGMSEVEAQRAMNVQFEKAKNDARSEIEAGMLPFKMWAQQRAKADAAAKKKVRLICVFSNIFLTPCSYSIFLYMIRRRRNDAHKN